MGNFIKLKNSKIPYLIWLILLVLLSLVIFGLFTKDLPSVDLSNESKGITSNIRNVSYYFFSTISQTIGALVAIVLTFFFTILNNLRANENLYANVIRRRLLKDIFLRFSLLLCLSAVLISILSLSFSGSNTFSINSFNFIGSVVILLVISGIYLFVMFILIRASLYNNPFELLVTDVYKDNYYTFKKLSVNDVIDFEELTILLVGEGHKNEYTDQYLNIFCKQKVPDREGVIRQFCINTNKSLIFYRNHSNKTFYKNIYNYIFKSFWLQNLCLSKDKDNLGYYYGILCSIIKNVDYKDMIDDLRLFINQSFVLFGEDSTVYSFDVEIPTYIPDDRKPNKYFYSLWLELFTFCVKSDVRYCSLLNTVFIKQLYRYLDAINYIDFNKLMLTKDRKVSDDEISDSSLNNNIIFKTLELFWFALEKNVIKGNNVYMNDYYIQMINKIRSIIGNDRETFRDHLNMLDNMDDIVKDIILKFIANAPCEFYRFISKFSDRVNIDLSKIKDFLSTFNFNYQHEKYGTIFNNMQNNKDNPYIDSFKLGFYYPIKKLVDIIYPKNNLESIYEKAFFEKIKPYLEKTQNTAKSFFNINLDYFEAGFFIRLLMVQNSKISIE